MSPLLLLVLLVCLVRISPSILDPFQRKIEFALKCSDRIPASIGIESDANSLLECQDKAGTDAESSSFAWITSLSLCVVYHVKDVALNVQCHHLTVDTGSAFYLKVSQHMDFEEQKNMPVGLQDCNDTLNIEPTHHGVNLMSVDGSILEVFCDKVTDGGDWIVFQRRLDGSEDFYLGWEDYKQGFGAVNREFWLGNRYLHHLTNGKTAELRFDLWDGDDYYWAVYSGFSLASENGNYRINFGTYSGNAGDSLSGHNGYDFSTYDFDNDVSGGNCALSFTGAWWYNSCHATNLNGLYNSTEYGKGVNWFSVTTHHRSLSATEIKFRLY